MIYGLLSALGADIGENRCGKVMIKVIFLIILTPYDIKMWVTNFSVLYFMEFQYKSK